MKRGWQTAKYPKAIWVPWQGSAFYRGINTPIATVLHIQEGWQRTYVQWARNGHYRASVHFSVGRDGTVYQFLNLQDGGYHAGITAAKARAYPPTWPLWKGPGINVNHYTVGIEHEGFHNEFPWPEPQRVASRELCLWLSDILEVPFTRDRFPSHAEIDLRDRPYDFARPSDREKYYAWLLRPVQNPEDEPMTPEEKTAFNALQAKVAQIGNDTHYLKQTTFGNSTPVTVTASNIGVVNAITGKQHTEGDTLTLVGDEAFEFASRMGLSLMLAHYRLSGTVAAITESLPIQEGDNVDTILRRLADAWETANG